MGSHIVGWLPSRVAKRRTIRANVTLTQLEWTLIYGHSSLHICIQFNTSHFTTYPPFTFNITTLPIAYRFKVGIDRANTGLGLCIWWTMIEPKQKLGFILPHFLPQFGVTFYVDSTLIVLFCDVSKALIVISSILSLISEKLSRPFLFLSY